jgi:hypothetical protein
MSQSLRVYLPGTLAPEESDRQWMRRTLLRGVIRTYDDPSQVVTHD